MFIVFCNLEQTHYFTFLSFIFWKVPYSLIIHNLRLYVNGNFLYFDGKHTKITITEFRIVIVITIIIVQVYSKQKRKKCPRVGRMCPRVGHIFVFAYFVFYAVYNDKKIFFASFFFLCLNINIYYSENLTKNN